MAKLYVGNLPFETTEEGLKAWFDEVVQPDRVTILRDKFTNRSRGFGFVEIDDEGAARKAIETLNGRSLGGRPVKVNEAKPMEPRGFGGGGGGDRRF